MTREEKAAALERRIEITRETLKKEKKMAQLSPNRMPEIREAMLQMVEDGEAHLILKNGTMQTFHFYAWPGFSSPHPFKSRRNKALGL